MCEGDSWGDLVVALVGVAVTAVIIVITLVSFLKDMS